MVKLRFVCRSGELMTTKSDDLELMRSEILRMVWAVGVCFGSKVLRSELMF